MGLKGIPGPLGDPGNVIEMKGPPGPQGPNG